MEEIDLSKQDIFLVVSPASGEIADKSRKKHKTRRKRKKLKYLKIARYRRILLTNFF